MKEVEVAGPGFTIESDRVFIGLGNSERKETGEGLAQAYQELGIFTHIDIVTLNEMAGLATRKALREEAKKRLLTPHSEGVTRVPAALQIVAFNPPEPTTLRDLAARAKAVTQEKIPKESTAWQSGPKDMFLAGKELASSPFTSARTPLMIARGFSTVEYLADRAESFPAGRAIVHSDMDVFGFQNAACLNYAAEKGITTVMLPNHWHMSALLEPRRTVGLLTPTIFPMPWGTESDLLS